MLQMRLRPDPAGGAHDAPPDPVVGWGGGYPLPTPTPRRLRRLDPLACRRPPNVFFTSRTLVTRPSHMSIR